MTPEAFALLAAGRGLDVRVDGFAAVRIGSARGAKLVDLTEELDMFILGIEGFTQLDDGGILPNLAWVLDTSQRFEDGARQEAADRAREFLLTIPKTDDIFLEFVLDQSTG